jgi:hypothetical protein
MPIGLAINSGNVAAGATGGGTGIAPGGGAAPGNVSAITVSGTLDPVALEISLVVTFTPPSDSGDTWTGVHAFLDIPDHGNGSTGATVGSSTVGSATVLGPFNPIDLGLQTNPTQPWYFSCPFPGSLGLNPNTNIPCRLYLASISVVSANALIQYGQTNATPNAAFTLVSLASGSPTAGTNIAPNCGTIECQALSPDTSTGKSMSPFLATMGSVPANPPKGWGYKLYLYTGTGIPTSVSGLTPLTDVCTTAGLVPPAKADLVTDVLNSFAIQTPGSVQQATVYAVAGLVSANGTFTANNIVPAITNSCIIEIGTSTGTIDAAQQELSSLSAEMQVSSGLFGLAPSGVTNEFLGSAAVETINIQNLAVENPQLASLAVEATNLASGSVTNPAIGTSAVESSNIQNLAVGTAAIDYGAITQALIANLAVGNAQLQSACIENAQLGTAVVAYGNIASCAVSSLIAGTATFSSTVVFENSSGPAVTITSTEVEVTGGTYTIGVNSSSGISISSSSASLDITTSISITNGSYSAVFGASSIVLEYSGGPNLSLFSSSIYLTATTNDYVEVTAGTITLVSGGISTTITSSSISVAGGTGGVGCGYVNCTGDITAATYVQAATYYWNASIFTTATAGTATLPSAPAGFMEVLVGTPLGSTTYKIPLYKV